MELRGHFVRFTVRVPALWRPRHWGTLWKDIEMPVHIAGFLSEGAQDLISRILNVDPNTRYTVNEIRSHLWCSQNSLKIPQGFISGTLKCLLIRRSSGDSRTMGSTWLYEILYRSESIQWPHNNVLFTPEELREPEVPGKKFTWD